MPRGRPFRRLSLQSLEPRFALSFAPTSDAIAVAEFEELPDRSLGMAEDGSMVVIYQIPETTEVNGIFAQRLDPAGMPIGPPILASDPDVRFESEATIAVGDDGRFLILWRGRLNGTDPNILGRLFNADGLPVGEIFPIAAGQAPFEDYQDVPVASFDPSGEFVVAWKLFDEVERLHHGYVRRFDASGMPLTDPTKFNSEGRVGLTAVAATSGGEFVLAWNGQLDPENPNETVYVRKFDAAAAPMSDELIVHVNGFDPEIAATHSGTLAVTWTAFTHEQASGTSTEILARLYSADLNFSDPFLVNEETRLDQDKPSIAMANDGRFVIAWRNDYFNEDPIDPVGRFRARVFNSDGTPATGEFTVNQGTANSHWSPSVAINDGGKLAFAWPSFGPAELHLRTFADFSDAELAQVASVRFSEDGPDILPQARLLNSSDRLIVQLTREVNDSSDVADLTSIMNRANWALIRDGTPTEDFFNSVSYVPGSDDSMPKAIIETVRTLPEGSYSLQMRDRVRSRTGGLPFDGNADGLAGAGFQLKFSILPITPVGGERLLNTGTLGDQLVPQTAMDADGNYAVTWQGQIQADGGHFEIYVRLFWADGTPRTGEIRIPSGTTHSKLDPAIGMNSQGDFVVAWSDNDDWNGGVRAQRFKADGVLVDEPFLVNLETFESQYKPKVAVAEDGSFVIIWTSLGLENPAQGSPTEGVFARVFDSNGLPRGPEFQVNTSTYGHQTAPDLAIRQDGVFVVVWNGPTHATNEFGDVVYARFFSAEGAPLGGEIRLHQEGKENRGSAAVDFAQSGYAIVVYSYQRLEAEADIVHSGIQAKLLSFDGSLLSDEIDVYRNTRDGSVTSFADRPDVAALTDDAFVVTFFARNQLADSFGVYARRFHPNGTPMDDVFIVNSFVDDVQTKPTVSSDGSKRFLVAWESQRQLGQLQETDIFAQQYDTGSMPLLADITGDGRVDLKDFNELKAHFTATGSGLNADLNRDREVDLVDFALLKLNFGVATAGVEDKTDVESSNNPRDTVIDP